jgi:hypothetical protein
MGDAFATPFDWRLRREKLLKRRAIEFGVMERRDRALVA